MYLAGSHWSAEVGQLRSFSPMEFLALEVSFHLVLLKRYNETLSFVRYSRSITYVLYFVAMNRYGMDTCRENLCCRSVVQKFSFGTYTCDAIVTACFWSLTLW